MSGSMPLIQPGTLVPFTFGASARGWHSMESWLTCGKEGQLKNVRRIRPLGTQMSEAFSIGILLHVARAQYLNDQRKGTLWREALAEYCKAVVERGDPPIPNSHVRVATLTFESYVAYWKVRPTTTPLAVEYELKPRGVGPATPEWAYRTARLDSVEFHQGKAWIGELKTTSQSPAKVHDTYALHGQVLMQMALWGEEETRLFGPLGGVMLDVMQKSDGVKPGKAYPRIVLPIESAQHALDWFRKDLVHWQMTASVVDWNARVTRSMACMRQYGPCQFRDLCLRGKEAAVQYEHEVEPGKWVNLSKWAPAPGKECEPWD